MVFESEKEKNESNDKSNNKIITKKQLLIVRDQKKARRNIKELKEQIKREQSGKNMTGSWPGILKINWSMYKIDFDFNEKSTVSVDDKSGSKQWKSSNSALLSSMKKMLKSSGRQTKKQINVNIQEADKPESSFGNIKSKFNIFEIFQKKN